MELILSIILVISVASFVVPFFFGKWIGTNGTIIVVTGNTFTLYSISIILIFYLFVTETPITIYVYNWLSIDIIDSTLTFQIDSLSLVMFTLITAVSLIAQIYSHEYLIPDPHLPRYYSFLGLFTFFMIFLVFSIDLLQLFFAWEGVGICSYLLINSRYFRYQANKASILAVLVNKIGDISFLIGVCIAYTVFYSSNVDFITKCSSYIFTLHHTDSDLFTFDETVQFNEHLLSSYLIACSGLNLYTVEPCCLFLFVACLGKSAQFILHIWLPEAMEGPTPVSPLLHAATMVTLGVFLILRMSFLFSQFPSILICMPSFGTFSIVAASISGCVQEDLKKTIAYSTCSQLGYMFVGCGSGDYVDTISQLFLHAFPKSMLFLLSGYIIYISSPEQDARITSMHSHMFPLSYVLLIVGTAGSIGVVPSGNAISKEFLLEFASCSWQSSVQYLSMLILWIVENVPFCRTLLTTLYPAQSIITMLYGTFDGAKWQVNNITVPPLLMSMPLLMLAAYSLFSGYYYSELLSGDSPFFFHDSLYISEDADSMSEYSQQSLNLDTIYVEPRGIRPRMNIRDAQWWCSNEVAAFYKQLPPEILVGNISTSAQTEPLCETCIQCTVATEQDACASIPTETSDANCTVSSQAASGTCEVSPVTYVVACTDIAVCTFFYDFFRDHAFNTFTLTRLIMSNPEILEHAFFTQQNRSELSALFADGRILCNSWRTTWSECYSFGRDSKRITSALGGGVRIWLLESLVCPECEECTECCMPKHPMLDLYDSTIIASKRYMSIFDERQRILRTAGHVIYNTYSLGFSCDAGTLPHIEVAETTVSEFCDHILESVLILTILIFVPLYIIFGFLTCGWFATDNRTDDVDSVLDEFHIFDTYYNRLYIVYYVRTFAKWCSKYAIQLFDKGALEHLCGFSIYAKVRMLINKYIRLETGYLYHSAGFFTITLMLLFFSAI